MFSFAAKRNNLIREFDAPMPADAERYLADSELSSGLRSGLPVEKLFVRVVQDPCAISAAPGIEIQKRPRFCFARSGLISSTIVR